MWPAGKRLGSGSDLYTEHGRMEEGFKKKGAHPLPQNCSVINAQLGIPCLVPTVPRPDTCRLPMLSAGLAATQHPYIHTYLSLPQKQKARPTPCVYRSTTEKYVCRMPTPPSKLLYSPAANHQAFWLPHPSLGWKLLLASAVASRSVSYTYRSQGYTWHRIKSLPLRLHRHSTSK